MWDGQSETCQPHTLFDAFVQAATCRETLRAFQELCKKLKLHPDGQPQFYHTLRSRLHDWKAKALWAKLDKRASQREYMRGHACTSTTVQRVPRSALQERVVITSALTAVSHAGFCCVFSV